MSSMEYLRGPFNTGLQTNGPTSPGATQLLGISRHAETDTKVLPASSDGVAVLLFENCLLVASIGHALAGGLP